MLDPLVEDGGLALRLWLATAAVLSPFEDLPSPFAAFAGPEPFRTRGDDSLLATILDPSPP